jgi:hypothetical protein
MSYFCVTLLEKFGGGSRREAATNYRIDINVLHKLGELSSDRGGMTDARKATARAPLTDIERSWVEAAIRAIGGHLAEGSDAPLTMTDLPSLS